ncbi:HGxxPAAW family protein [Jonesia quinghaiensis]|uniref:HGxxPAAW family protein n=1 Tax=Jonesia quinghaiensis TaxID=262806 RepID=UPI00041DEF87|nr:HGxxPAAW family protein [Jonesia quinghaiensis]
MSVKDVDYSQNILHPHGMELPSTVPPKNHGHTPAAWFLTIVVALGSLIVGLGMPLNSMVMIGAGVVVVIVGLVGGVVLSLAGKGQARPAKNSSSR